MPAVVKRIAIKGTSGYTCEENAYEDTLVVTPKSIRYARSPAVESPNNPYVKWAYKTDSNPFASLFAELATLADALVNDDGIRLDCCDIGMTRFSITYDDGTRTVREYFQPPEELGGCIEAARKMIPAWETIPDVLWMSQD